MNGIAQAFPWRTISTIAMIVVTQVMGNVALVRSAGCRDITWTTACIAIYLLSFWLLARVIHQGMALSLVIPVLSALIPMATVVVAVVVLSEPASWSKIGFLMLACLMIGAAARV